MLKRGTINEKQFDLFVEKVCHGDGVFIVDTGATTFVPLWNYILENEILDFFRAHGRSVFVHSVVTGGQAMTDTLNGLERLAQTTSQKNVIVWLNEYFGEVTKDGKTFEEFKVAEEYAPKLVGTVVIRDRNPHTYGDDVRQMLEQRLTFDEAIKDAKFFLVSKQNWRLCDASCLSNSTSWLSPDLYARRERFDHNPAAHRGSCGPAQRLSQGGRSGNRTGHNEPAHS